MERDPAEVLSAFLRSPDGASFAPLHEATKRLVWTICRRVLDDAVEAEEAFQSTYCRLLELARRRGAEAARAVPGIAKPECAGAAELLGRIACLEADRLRKRRARRRSRERPLAESSAMPDRSTPPLELAARREARERVDALIRSLPEACALPIQLHYLHGLPQRQVASILALPLSTVSERIRAGLRRLERPFRRAGLGGPGGLLAAIAASTALLEPGRGLDAAAVYARAEQALAAGTLAASAASTAPGPISGSIAAMGGVLIMKFKVAIVLALILAALAAFLVWKFPPAAGPVAGDPRPQPAPVIAAAPKDAAGGPEGGAAPEPAAGVLAVEVVWMNDNSPAADAEVRVRNAGGAADDEAAARTGADGRCRVEVPAAPGKVQVTARHAHAPAVSREHDLREGEVLRIELARDVIAGLVLDAGTGAPLAGARVSLDRSLESASAVADAEGAWSLVGLGAGTHALLAAAPGYASQTAQVLHQLPGGISVHDFRLDPAVRLDFLVLDAAGAPIAGASVIPSVPGSDGIFRGDRGVETDADGRARLEDISRLRPPQIQVSRDGFQRAYYKPPADPGAAERTVEIRLLPVDEKARAIAGRITDERGRPIAGAVVQWKDAMSTSFGRGVVQGRYRAVSGETGEYLLEYVDASPDCMLGVSASGFAPRILSMVRAGPPGSPARIDVTLAAGRWLRGRVVDEDGRPLAGVRLRAMPEMHRLNEAEAYPVVMREVRTDDSGRFEFSDLAGPTVAIEVHRAKGDDRPSQNLELEVDREIEIVYAGWGALRGRVIDAATGEPVVAFRIRRLASGVGISPDEVYPGLSFTSADGKFAIEKLDPQGTYTLIVEAEGYAPAVLDDLDPRPAEPLEVALERGGVIEGIIIDAMTAQPIAEAELALLAEENAAEYLGADWARLIWIAGCQRGSADAAGGFRFRESRPSTLLVRRRGYQSRLVAPGDRALLAGADGRLRIPLERGRRIAGLLRDAAGEPRPAEDLRLEPVAEEGTAGDDKDAAVARQSARTGPDGSWVFDGVGPGTYDIVYVEQNAPRQGEIETRRRVRVGAGADAGIDLGGRRDGIEITGVLGGMEGRESLGATIILRRIDESGIDEEIRLRTYRDWGWRYRFPALARGRYGIAIEYYSKSGNTRAELPPVEIAAAGTIELALPAGAP